MSETMAPVPVRVPPHNLDAESSLLGAMLVTADAVVEARAVLSAGDFYSPAHARIFSGICSLHDRGEPVDAVGVSDELRRGGEHDKQLDVAMNAMMANSAPHAARRHAGIVAECAAQRKVIAFADELKARAFNREHPTKLAALIDAARPELPSDREHSWLAVDIAALRASGLSDVPAPVACLRTDGQALVYAGAIHSFNGVSESGKSWATCLCAVQEVKAGRRVAYVDFEDDATTVLSRMLAIGATWEEIEAHLTYVRPDEPVSSALLDRLVELEASVVVLDGVTEAMVLHDLDPMSNRDSARFIALLARPFARAGAAVIQVDHVTKNPEQRSNYAIGAQHKRAAITGSMFSFTVTRPIGRGLTGEVAISVDKDKPGHVRRAAIANRIALMSLSSNPEGTIVRAELRPPSEGAGGRALRPTVLMERVSRALEEVGQKGLSTNGLKGAVKGKNEFITTATELLAAEEFVVIRQAGQAKNHVSVRPYRRSEDPLDPDHESTNRSPTTTPQPIPFESAGQ